MHSLGLGEHAKQPGELLLSQLNAQVSLEERVEIGMPDDAVKVRVYDAETLMEVESLVVDPVEDLFDDLLHPCEAVGLLARLFLPQPQVDRLAVNHSPNLLERDQTDLVGVHQCE